MLQVTLCSIATTTSVLASIHAIYPHLIIICDRESAVARMGIVLKLIMSIIMMVTKFSLCDQAQLTKEITSQVKGLSDDDNEELAVHSD